jgi:hypothetical protein
MSKIGSTSNSERIRDLVKAAFLISDTAGFYRANQFMYIELLDSLHGIICVLSDLTNDVESNKDQS